MSRDTRDLHPTVKAMAEELLTRCHNKGIPILYTSTLRTNEEQEALYALGRTKPGKKVTNAPAGSSYHNYGLAVDFAVIKDWRPTWDLRADVNANNLPDYTEVGIIAEEMGFEWGGRWTHFKDYPHLQYTFGLTLVDLRSGKLPPQPENL